MEGLENRTTPATINLTTVADNTLYQVSGVDSQQLSNGAGQHFFVGDTNQGSNAIRRGAIKFDLSAVPAGSTITSATLTLNMSKTTNGAQNIALHRALMNWGEGTSIAGTNGMHEGMGTQATTGDVTWFYTFFSSQRWTTPGGDFVATPSASTSVNAVGSYQWTGAGLTADVQQWLNNPATDFGWILTGNETKGDTSKEFDTKENTNATRRPVLTVNFTAPLPNLTIAKSHTGNFRQGDAADTYTLNVSNIGLGPTTGTVTVTDTPPTGLAPTAADSGTINGWSVSTSGQTITATRSDVLANGSSYPALTLTVSVANNAPASVTNTATVAGGGAVNPASASDLTTIIQVANLTISKSHTGNFRQGDAADIYTLTVNNIGPGPTVGTVTITDTLPTGLVPTAADNGTINGWSVTTNGQSITATRGDVLAPSSSYPVLTLTVSVANNTPASVTNTATVAGGGTLNAASASDPTTIIQGADLTISKKHTGTFHPGDSADSYTIIVSNVGAAPTDGSTVTVTDTLPAGLAPTAADSGTINGWTVSFSGQTVTGTRNDVLNNGASYPALIITVSVANNIAPIVTNTATVAGGGAVNTASASDPTATTPVADLTISKSHTANFRQGDAADIYTLTVHNIGEGPTVGTVTITDPLPTGLAPTAADNGIINGWTVTTNGQTITATRGDVLAPSSSYPVLTLTVSVANNAPTSVTNTATVGGDGTLNPASASDPTTIIRVADLTIRKSHTGIFHPGDSADTYTITVSNVGAAPTDGSTVTVTDKLPTGLAPTAADNGTINGWTVSFSGETIIATRSDVLANGSSYPVLTLTVRVANNAPASVTNIATVAGGGEVNTANDTASDPTTITQAAADLTISMSHKGTFHPGDSADTYTITVSNVGEVPTDGSTVTVTDTLPAGLAPTAADSGTINGWTVVTNGQTVIATRSDVLANGSSYPALTLTVRVANNAPASVTNTATVAGGGEVNTANDTANDVTTITPVADLTIAISHSGNFNAGATGTYTITVTNIGRAATNAPVTIIDMLPAGLTYAGLTTVNGWTISVNGQTITATRTDVLARGASFPALTLTVSVASDAPASFINNATVSGGGEVNISAASDVAGGQTPRRRGADATLGSSAKSTSAVLDSVANAFTHSEEYLTDLVIQDYLQLLHRTPGAAEVNSWVGLLKSGLSDEQVLAGFTSSAEYYLQAGGTDQAWLGALYHDVLGRSPDAAGEAAWLLTLASGASRFRVAHGLATSVEHESIVVAGDYHRYLGRSANASEVAGWVNNLQHGMSNEQIVAAFMASDEFYSGHGGSIQGWLNSAYQIVFQRDPDPSGFTYWYGYLQNQLVGG